MMNRPRPVFSRAGFFVDWLHSAGNSLQDRLDHSIKSASLDIASLMRRFWQILAITMLALMVPASMCCLLPQLAAKDCSCCNSPERNRDAPAPQDNCPSDTIAHSKLPLTVIMPQVQMVELVEIIQQWTHLLELSSQEAAPVPLMSTAPPELRTTWVFASRAALPVRAPSELA